MSDIPIGIDEKLGIDEFFKALKPTMKSWRINLKSLRGCKVGLDASSFIVKGAVYYKSCKDLCHGIQNPSYINYCVDIAKLLASYDIDVIFVFHGKKLALEEKEQNRLARGRGYSLWKAIMMDHFQSYRKALNVTAWMKSKLMDELRKNQIEYMIAPYDANAQLTFLNKIDHVQAVISEDYNLIPYGCPRFIYKMDVDGNGYDFEFSKLQDPDCSVNLSGFSEDRVREMCVLCGCKYYHVLACFEITYSCYLEYESAEEMKEKILDEWYYPWGNRSNHDFEKFNIAVLAYKFHKVYDPRQRKITYLNDLPPPLAPETLNFLAADTDINTSEVDITNIEVTSYYMDFKQCQEESRRRDRRTDKKICQDRQNCVEDDGYIIPFNSIYNDNGYVSLDESSDWSDDD